MKRLVFCFDGTWNKLNPDLATNVVLTAASIQRTDDDGIAQIIHYDEGVGTDELEKVRGGVFGQGLVKNLREAYRFLIFNYDPGDEIYVFGFSRGAFSARSFIGLIRQVGPLERLHVGRIDEAIKLYQDAERGQSEADDELRRFRSSYSGAVCIDVGDDAWRCGNVAGYQQGQAPLLKIKFLGVWDTVGALGWPKILPYDDWLNRNHAFHDASVDAFVENARHAVAIDERRKLFPVELMGDLSSLNRNRGFADHDHKAPYQERWFPGDHGSVGGGGDIRQLSDSALAWVLIGAKRAGLRLDTNAGTRIHDFRPDPLASLDNENEPSWSFTDLMKGDRDGPEHLWQLSPSAIRRWRTPGEKVTGGKYRPGTLATVADQLDAMGALDFVPPTDLLDTVIVQPSDSLSKYAYRFYGNAELWPVIAAANSDTLDDPDEIFPGQSIRIPRKTDPSGGERLD
ncbi:MAG: DUF2235 domain-containing protein [Sphingobium limneticum]